ncbi:MAG: hypothetical protein ABR915_04565 [Thermoguttaceae bacterium]|jgi:hypothetical protein
MRRHILGILALLLLAAAAVLALWPGAGGCQQFELFCWRLGTVLAVWWLAYPDLRRLPAWLLGALPVVAIVLVWRPRYVLLVIPVLVVLAILKPRWGDRPSKR